MFQHLDSDADGQLSLQELYDLEHDQNEHCIKPFLDACDTDRWNIWLYTVLFFIAEFFYFAKIILSFYDSLFWIIRCVNEVG